MKKRWTALGALLFAAGFSTLSFLSFQNPPTILGDLQPPPFGPVPCPNDPLSKVVNATWSNSVKRHNLLAREVDRRAAYKREVNHGPDPNDVWRWRLPIDIVPGLVLKQEADRVVGPKPSAKAFRAEMQRLGFECVDQVFAANEYLPVPSVQISCRHSVPAGCPSKFGHWPIFVIRNHALAIASYRQGDPDPMTLGYSSREFFLQ